MTLEQATEQSAAAAAAGDLDALAIALAARRKAMAGLEDPARLKASLEAGESVARDIRLLKLKLSIDANRLAQIQSALLIGLGSDHRPQISYQA